MIAATRVFVLRVPAPEGGVLVPAMRVDDIMQFRGNLEANTVAMPVVKSA